MRLHTLTMTAFGPYPGTSRVDFDALSGAGLFLLHGPTGAGKSSVLDAVCYALYGGVPGTRAGTRLRSDHADPGVPTQVALELTAGGRRLEITRRPEQPRPKRRGTGTTLDKAVTLLRERVPGGREWKALSRSHQEAGEEIRQVLGMSREQFCQVVLLPQGEFARFLRSDAKERADLLGRLFDTGRFEAVERWLADARRAAEARLRARDEQLIGLAHRIGQAAGAAALDRPYGELAPGEPELAEQVLVGAAVARAGARERRDIAALALDAAERAHRSAGRRLEEARELAGAQRRHADARRRAAELDAQAERFTADVELLERARAADAVAPALEALAGAETDRESAGSRARWAAAELPDRFEGADAARLTAHEHETRQEIGRLEAARRAERRVAEIRAEHDRLERDAVADDDLERDTTAWLASWEETRDACRRRIDAAQEAATAAEAIGARLEEARRRAEAARRRDALIVEERDAAAHLLASRAAAADAHERWLGLREERLRGIAAELAAGLGEGTPCPVCGSAVHPEPARPGAGHVDRAAEESARCAHRAAEAGRAGAETACTAVRERLAAARAEAADRTTGELDAEVARLTADRLAARGTAADLHPAKERLRADEQEHARRLDTQRETQKRQAARTSHREALDGEVASLRAEVAAAAPDGTVAERIGRLERLARLLGEAADAARDRAAADRRLDEARQRAEETARRAGFDRGHDAAQAVLSAARREELRDGVEARRARRAAVEAELADPRVAAAAAAPPADPRACSAALDAATVRLRGSSATDTAARQRCAELDRLSAAAAGLAAAAAPLREEHTRLRRLAQLTAGTSAENELRMRLESYVLAARLEQVAAAASVRLRRMSGGRYTLTHTDARAAGRVRSGLGLRVADAWTGTERDTATLSGGETFFASLALALGLADVVTDEAGAVRLDTLFIDEGFGSLDDQTLDDVLDVLDALRERDRTVGIVSHVADLRHRIPSRLEVVKGRDGSRVRQRTPGGRGSPAGPA